MRDDERSVERRLDAWGVDGRGDAGDGGVFLDQVARVRAGRQRVLGAIGMALVAVVTAALWVMIPAGGLERETIVESGGEGRGVAVLAWLGDGAGEWSVAALSRRAGHGEFGDEDLLPPGWSMGWASKPAL